MSLISSLIHLPSPVRPSGVRPRPRRSSPAAPVSAPRSRFKDNKCRAFRGRDYDGPFVSRVRRVSRFEGAAVFLARVQPRPARASLIASCTVVAKTRLAREIRQPRGQTRSDGSWWFYGASIAASRKTAIARGSRVGDSTDPRGFAEFEGNGKWRDRAELRAFRW